MKEKERKKESKEERKNEKKKKQGRKDRGEERKKENIWTNLIETQPGGITSPFAFKFVFISKLHRIFISRLIE